MKLEGADNAMICCTFAGHRHIPAPRSSVDEVIETILQTDRAFTFYSGGMGEFDAQCEAAVRGAKRRHPELAIQLVLVLPYMSNRLNTYKTYYEEMYDGIVIPEELLGVHPKAAITMRNRWMVDASDYVIACVRRDFGGAYETVKYARQAGRVILDITENNV